MIPTAAAKTADTSERIERVAIRQAGHVYSAARARYHGDVVAAMCACGVPCDLKQAAQGFVTTTGRFVVPGEAAAIPGFEDFR